MIGETFAEHDYLRKKMILEKTNFVEGSLTRCLSEAISGIEYLTYDADDLSETVTVHFGNGSTRKVDVSADSLPAIIKDIVKAVW